ncbi:PHD finger protein 3-like [Anguilla rostrata]|uniref:PHD finger protein 3-like n=1 Tax=Anguilla rostrata TaxID=7938 RepID=UPI0030CE4D7F
MVGCGRCDDWFHGDCVGLDLAKAQQMEQEDQEYVCLKCCAEEDRKCTPPAEGPPRTDGAPRAGHAADGKPAGGQDRKEPPATATAGVRVIKKDCLERKLSMEVRDAEGKAASASDQRGSQAAKASLAPGDSAPKTGVHEKQEVKKLKSSPTASKKPSVEQIRRNVRDSLKDILLQRLKESNLKVSLERAGSVATKTEKELFAFFRDTDSKYKSKYRSLMFNLKDAKNNVLFKRVLKGEISPEHLIRMSPEELASKELAAWRQRENRHTIEMIEKEQREVERRPITKITHKGEIEIESQEPAKQPETTATVDAVPRSVEEPKEVPVESDSEGTKDTTGQHKAHLFDLNCKICTGRMAPPADDAATKVVKVATTVVRRQSGADAELRPEAPPTQLEELSLTTLEECLSNPSVLSLLDGTPDSARGRQDEAAFLARLDSLWKGFVNMPSVAKFVTKAYPVSGVLDQLTEVREPQIGGIALPRLTTESKRLIWFNEAESRAEGGAVQLPCCHPFQEVCLIRFSPATEEDEIAYTLLYAYFSSRRRYGVVANNTKQVKDTYLIPLGAAEKIPHQLVPFDGPGLEANRANLLLGLVIRQRVRRDYGAILPLGVAEPPLPKLAPESRAKGEPALADGERREGDGFDPAREERQAETAKQPQPAQAEPGQGPGGEGDALATEGVLQEPEKPLRFLPGVLLGGEGPSAPPQDAAAKPPSAASEAPPGEAEKDADKRETDAAAATAPDGAGQEPAPNKSPAPIKSPTPKSPASNGPRLDRFVIKKKEPKPAKSEPPPSATDEKQDSCMPPGKEAGTAPKIPPNPPPSLPLSPPHPCPYPRPHPAPIPAPQSRPIPPSSPPIPAPIPPSSFPAPILTPTPPHPPTAPTPAPTVSLKDKPPDVSTEAFLAHLSQPPAPKEPPGALAAPPGSAAAEAKASPAAPVHAATPATAVRAGTPPKDAAPTPGPVAVTSPTKDPRQPTVPLNDSPSPGQEKQGGPVAGGPGQDADKGAEKDLSSERESLPVPDRDQHSSAPPAPAPPAPPQREYRPVEDIQSISTVSSCGTSERRGSPLLALPPAAFSPGGLGPPATGFPSPHPGSPPFKYRPPPSPVYAPQSGAPPPFKPLRQPAPPVLGYPGSPPLLFPQPEPHLQNHAMTWPRPAPSPASFPPAPGPPPLASFSPPAVPVAVAAAAFEASRFLESSKPPPQTQTPSPTTPLALPRTTPPTSP